jgi:hypothetical protein
MTPADAAAPEQSGADPVVTVLLVVPVIVASTELDSAKSEVTAIVIAIDLIIPILPFAFRGPVASALQLVLVNHFADLFV